MPRPGAACSPPVTRSRRSLCVTVHGSEDSVAVAHDARAPHVSVSPVVTPAPTPATSPVGSAAGNPTTTPPSTAVWPDEP